MKIRSLIFVMAICLYGTISVFAEGLKRDDHLSSSIPVKAKDNNNPDPKAIAESENAMKLVNKLERDLKNLQDLSSVASNIINDTDRLSCLLKTSDNEAKRRRDLLSQFPEKANAVLESRNAVLKAVNDYQTSADEAIKEMEAYASADEKSAQEKADLADNVMEKKAELRRKADDAFSEASNTGREFNTFLGEILSSDVTVKKYCSDAYKTGEEIISLCDELTRQVKNHKAELVFAVNRRVPNIRAGVVSILKLIWDMQASDTEAYKRMLNDINEMSVRDIGEYRAVEAYFEDSVYIVVKNEAHSFLDALYRVGNASKDEIDSSAKSLKMAKDDAEKAIAEIRNNISNTKKSIDMLSKRIPEHPTGLKGNDSLINQSSALLIGFDDVMGKVQAAVDAKKEEYDKAYYLAYGNKSMKADAAPYQNTVSRSASVISVEDHVYTYVSIRKDEPKDYGAYTYVLFGHDFKNAQKHVKERYESLLKAIYRSTSSIHNFSAKIPKDKLNLFCIPIKKRIQHTREEVFEGYDSDLARSYLGTAGSGAILRGDIIERIKTPGPFLLTTRSRLSKGGSKNQLLFADLSNYPPEAFDSILQEYKIAIVEYPPSGQELWKPQAINRVLYLAIATTKVIPNLSDKLKQIFSIMPSSEGKPGGINTR